MTKFQNRIKAGELLGHELMSRGLRDAVVLTIPRGGVPVGGAVAQILECPFDIVPLLKIPIPWSPEASYGAVAMDGTMALNQPLISRLEVSMKELEMTAEMVAREVKRREQLFRRGRPYPDITDKTVIIIDDGLGSGYSMLAAVNFVKKRNPRAIIVAAPIASDTACAMLSAAHGISMLVVLVRNANPVFSVSAHYKDFQPVTDEEVIRMLK